MTDHLKVCANCVFLHDIETFASSRLPSQLDKEQFVEAWSELFDLDSHICVQTNYRRDCSVDLDRHRIICYGDYPVGDSVTLSHVLYAEDIYLNKYRSACQFCLRTRHTLNHAHFPIISDLLDSCRHWKGIAKEGGSHA